MSEPGEYESVEKVMAAVNAFVDSHKKWRPGHFSSFKVEVYVGRGVFEFSLNDKVGDAKKKVAQLEKELEKAKQDLETLQPKKRTRENSE